MPNPLLPVKFFLRTLPDSIHSRLLSRLFNHFLRGQPITKKLLALHGKRVQLSITDTGNCWRFIILNEKLRPNPSRQQPFDIHISGSLKHFLLLATQHEDPDALFFNRQLSLEGNTEDGLYLKNILDAMDFDIETHLQVVFGKSLAKYLKPVINSIKPDVQIRRLGDYLHTMD